MPRALLTSIASGMPIVATEATMSTSRSREPVRKLLRCPLGEAHPVVDRDQERDRQVFGDPYEGRSMSWAPTFVV